MNIQKQKILATVAMVALLVGFGLFAFNAGRDHEKYIYLTEGVGMDKEPVIYGHLTIIVIDENGIAYLAWSEHNVITNVGRNATREYLGVTGGAAFDYIAIGTGTGGGAASDALQTEVFREQGTYSDTATAYNWTITYTWAAATFSGEVITEAGCFNASSSGVLFNYQDFSGITLTASDSLQVQFEFMVTSG